MVSTYASNQRVTKRSIALKPLEEKMQKYLVKDAPFQIPENGKKAIAQWAPWISLIIGVLSLLSAYSLWNLAHRADRLIDYANEFSRAYGLDAPSKDISVFVYVAIIFIIAQGILLIAAFKGLQDRKKSNGWNFLLYSAIASFVYSIISLFLDDYRGFGSFVFGLLGTLVGLYILAQISNQYIDSKTPQATKKK